MSYIRRSLLQDTIHASKKDLVSIFCTCNDSEEGVVASIALQLLQSKVRAKVLQSELPLLRFQLCDKRLDINRHLWGLLSMLIRASPDIVVIIDGIDKLDSAVRSSFLDRFGKLEEEAAIIGMQVLISSEKNDDIQSALSHYSSIDREKERRGK